ncbi:hypothetical protein BCR43DRAFT_498702 [Syncephalastrum racemosum]|uniref:Uncharacterized protein n=1 Tax=Syncephalastrum racemosum TaxID=13706 RepID=A0A1X2H1A7_SYNRA|nr:hypothetical protein BCR43DRAFT_498702 [Syncephalastrum racemosum]
MQDLTEEHKLAKLMEGITVASEEERITRQLASTHLKSNGHAMFGDYKGNTSPLAPKEETATPEPSWATASPAPSTNTGDEGWGDLPPAYTAISQDHRFGFSSILAPRQLDTFQKPTSSLDSRQAFSRYVNQPVSFASLAQAPSVPQQYQPSVSMNSNNDRKQGYDSHSNKRDM